MGPTSLESKGPRGCLGAATAVRWSQGRVRGAGYGDILDKQRWTRKWERKGSHHRNVVQVVQKGVGPHTDGSCSALSGED